MSYWLAAIVAIYLSVCPAQGQRVFATIDASALDSELEFDTNDLPIRSFPAGAVPPSDLNFSPNVVFSPDSTKAFVGFPGSDKILVFDPKTGETTKPGYGVVQVGKNPALITLAPNTTKLAVVSVFVEENLPDVGENFQGQRVGSVSTIDVKTLEVKTLVLEQVFFSFLNNVVFSSDSKTGFLASSGTDEVLRFDVETMTEIAPRLKTGEGTRPSAITMAPDFSFFAVVLSGSTTLDQLEVPDSIEIIDPNSFSTIRNIVPQSDIVLPHGFVATNNLAISEDSKFGLIGDQENSSFAGIPALARDHAILLDLETGETVQVFDVGGLAGPAYTVPGQRSFVVVGNLSFTLVEIDSLEVALLNPFPADFKSTGRAAFSKDGRKMFLAAPTRDTLLVADLERKVITQSVEIGPSIQAEIEGQTITLPSAPMDVALSPDESVITAVKFNADKIDLVRDSQRFIVPRILANDQWFTGVAVTNNSSQIADITVTGIDQRGALFRDDLNTEDVVEFVNPNTLSLAAGEQSSFTADGLLNPAPGKTIEGWFDFDSDQFDLSSFFLIADHQMRRQDGGAAVFESHTRFIFPEVRVTDGFVTELSMLNPNRNPSEVTVTLLDGKGAEIEQVTQRLVGRQVLTRPLRDPDPEDSATEGLFAEESFAEFTEGYVEVTGPEGVIVLGSYLDTERLATLGGIVLGPEAQLQTEWFLPQAVTFGGFETSLKLINTAAESAQVVLTLFFTDSQGQEQSVSSSLTMEAGELVGRDLADLFNLTDPGVTLSGWVRIQSSVVGVIADAEIRAFSGRAMTTVAAQGPPEKTFVFSHVAQTSGISTGVALVNPGTETATVSIEIFAPDGSLAHSLTFTLAASSRRIGLLPEFFPELSEAVGGHIKVTSDRDIVGLEIFFSNDLEYLAAVPAQQIGRVKRGLGL